MEKYKNNKLVEPTDAIVLLNDNYESIGLKKGYVGTVVDNCIDKLDIILVDFFNPFTGEDIKNLIEIKAEDFKVVSNSKEDQLLVKAFRDLFR